jgi:hypothetical protein
MKIGGVPVTEPTEELLVLPRSDKSFVFRAKALPDMENFNALCPTPKPPGVLTKDGWVADAKDPNYAVILSNWHMQRAGYMIVHTLSPSNIEWDTIDGNNPKTWTRWEDEMRKAGFTQAEVNRIYQFVIEVNSLSEDKLQQARDSFLRGQAVELAQSSGPHTEQASTPSGEPATASA